MRNYVVSYFFNTSSLLITVCPCQTKSPLVTVINVNFWPYFAPGFYLLIKDPEIFFLPKLVPNIINILLIRLIGNILLSEPLK